MEQYESDRSAAYDYYNKNFKKYGYSEKSLGWMKGKQNIRFLQLTKYLPITDNIKIFDVGCGFGDFNRWMRISGHNNYRYLGVDMVEGFIQTAQEIYENDEKCLFVCDDFLNMHIDEKYDWVIGSGIFNIKMKHMNNYDNIYNILSKAYEICEKDGALAFDFLSDKVDYIANDLVFHNSPERVLEIAYKFSRNVILDNSYMPFEFSVIIFKDDSFSKENTTFNRFIANNLQNFEAGIF